MSSLIYPTSFENEKYKAMPVVQSAAMRGFSAVVVVAIRDDASDLARRYPIAGQFGSYMEALLAGRHYARELIKSLP